MPDGVVPVHLLSLPDPLPEEDMRLLSDEIGNAFDRAGVDGEVLLVAGAVETIARDELLRALEDSDGDE